MTPERYIVVKRVFDCVERQMNRIRNARLPRTGPLIDILRGPGMCSWISVNRLDKTALCRNPSPHLFSFLEENPEWADPDLLFSLPSAGPFLVRYAGTRIPIKKLCTHPSVPYAFLKGRINEIQWVDLAKHTDPQVLQWVMNTVTETNDQETWSVLLSNPHPYVIQWIQETLLSSPIPITNSMWHALSMNPSNDLVTLLQSPEYVDRVPADIRIGPQKYENEIERYQIRHYRPSNRGADRSGDGFNLSMQLTPKSIAILTAHPPMINWYHFCVYPDPRILSLLKKDWKHFLQSYNNFKSLSKNHHPLAMELLAPYLKYADWAALSSNPCAISFLKQHPHRIDWTALCSNPHPDAIDLLEQRMIERGGDVSWIDWKALSSNPAIFRV